jgi:hypothetical protein
VLFCQFIDFCPASEIWGLNLKRFGAMAADERKELLNSWETAKTLIAEEVANLKDSGQFQNR